MKYLIVLALLFTPFLAKAEVFGFMNGNFYDINGNLKYACLMDKSCYDYSSEKMTTLSKILGYQVSVPESVTIGADSSQTNFSPTLTSIDTPITPEQVDTQPIIDTQPSCTLTAVNQDDYKDYRVLLTWTSQNLATTTGFFYPAYRMNGETPDFNLNKKGTPISANGSYPNVGRFPYYEAVFGNISCIAKLSN